MLLWIIVGILVILIIWAISVYNGVIVLKNRTEESWSDIDVQLKRRHDLIPNLIETVKGYAKHEKDLFEQVTKARSEAISAKEPADLAGKENALSGALRSVFAVAENYPELKASQNFIELQNELSDTENKIEAARRFYNTNVRDFNTKVQIFPNSIIANMMSPKSFELFEANTEEKETPVVGF